MKVMSNQANHNLLMQELAEKAANEVVKLGEEVFELKGQLDDILTVQGPGGKSLHDGTRIRLEVLNQVREVERRCNEQVK